ncbi:MAG: outer membrane beta-barrel protein [Flavobacteriales bacterium]
MKKLLTAIALAALTGNLAFAQNEASPDTVYLPSQADTTRIMLGGTQVILINSNDKSTTVDLDDDDEAMTPRELSQELTFWAGIDLGVNTLFNANGVNAAPDDAPWLDTEEIRSLSWSFNFYEEKIRLVKNYVGILTGAALTYNSYGIKSNSRIQHNADSTFASEVPDSLYRFSKNKLRATYLRVPLMLEFNTSEDPDRTFHIAVGAIGGLRIGSITKQFYEIDGQEYRDRVKSDFNLSSFTLDAAVRVGYRNFTLWANYGLTPLFEDGKGPEVYPLSVGLSLAMF